MTEQLIPLLSIYLFYSKLLNSEMFEVCAGLPLLNYPSDLIICSVLEYYKITELNILEDIGNLFILGDIDNWLPISVSYIRTIVFSFTVWLKFQSGSVELVRN